MSENANYFPLDNLDEDEVNLMIVDIFTHFGYDFSNYSKSSFKRRLSSILRKEKMNSIKELHHKIINDNSFFNTFLENITINVTELFRNPLFYKALREKVVPFLKKKSSIRVWHAGCSTGEEIYSVAILLKESGLLEKSYIYGTDINQKVLEEAEKGIFLLENINQYSENYKEFGGKFKFSDYYNIQEGKGVFDSELKKNVFFSSHNLVTDQSFNEFDLILCRNVLIYFDSALQSKVIKLFYDSLPKNGFLALGNRETICFSAYESYFEKIDEQNKIWMKIDVNPTNE